MLKNNNNNYQNGIEKKLTATKSVLTITSLDTTLETETYQTNVAKQVELNKVAKPKAQIEAEIVAISKAIEHIK